MNTKQIQSPLRKRSFFAKEYTAILKGISFMFMLLNHFFGCRTFLVDESMKWIGIPFFNIMGNNAARVATPLFGSFKDVGGMSLLEYELGDFSRIGLAIFIFISGYGLYSKFRRQKNLKEAYKEVFVRLKKFLISYWVILFLVIVPVIICLKKFSFKLLLANIIPLIYDFKVLFVGVNWYVRVYVLFLLTMPLLIKAFRKGLLPNLAIFVVVPYALINMYDHFIGLSFDKINHSSWIVVFGYILLESVCLYFRHVSMLTLGMFFAKYPLFEMFEELILKIKNGGLRKALCVVILALVFVLRIKINYYSITDAIYTPVFIFAVAFLAKDKTKGWFSRFLSLLGKYSFELWIIHGLFFTMTSELQFIAFLPRFSVFIIAWCLLLILPVAWCMQRIAQMAERLPSAVREKIKKGSPFSSP